MTATIIDQGFTQPAPAAQKPNGHTQSDPETLIKDEDMTRAWPTKTLRLSRSRPGHGTTSSRSGCPTCIPSADM
ncbi:hypothetical protein [Bifidobacterium moukalabense]|uniref:hypothetical protein n=1 Tax=Bifidobacterium moukalabense TaxID=1333651 RepID=UPI0010F6A4C8|nr:hypothetical protein [Bifidobacterium moukalabense]